MPSANAPPHHRACVFVPGEGSALTVGMDFVVRVLDEIVVPPVPRVERQDAEDILLVACELLSNACAHTSGPTRIDLDLQWGRLCISVTDPSPSPPLRHPHQPDVPRGHGLPIVETLALRWGCTPSAQGKVVWAVLPLRGFSAVSSA